MIRLIIGGQGQGKLKYIISSGGYKDTDISFCEKDDIDKIFEKDIICGLHHLVKILLQMGKDPKQFILDNIEEKTQNAGKDIIIISDEIGCGLVPMDIVDRNFRDIYGEIMSELAKKSWKVERVFAGIPQVLKSVVTISLIRHGKTNANISKLYHGATDQNLSQEGIDSLKSYVQNGLYPKHDVIYSSPLKRCLETSKIIFENKDLIIVKELSECNFGQFEGKTHDEIISIPGYSDFGMNVASMSFPDGETVMGFANRCVTAFREVGAKANTNNISRYAVVCHGGVIMAIMNRTIEKKSDMYEWYVGNGLGYILEYNTITQRGIIIRRLEN